MQFLNADSTFILIALLTLIGVVWMQRFGADRRRRLVATFVGRAMAGKLTATLDPAKRQTRQILLVVGLAFVFLAAARPWWGKRLVHAPKRSRDVLVALDCSRSMLARDVAPTRLKHAQWWLRELMKDCVGDRFGLIAFAGDAFLECPLTQDVNTVFQFLDDLDTDTIPVGGTNMETALAAAHKAFEGAEGAHRAVLLVTDGDELEGDAGEEIEFFREHNIPLFVVGVGTPQGSMVQLEDNSYLRDADGELVLAKLNEGGLRKLAESTQGIYVRSTAVTANVGPVKRRIRELVPQSQEASISNREIERFQAPLFIGLILLLLRMLLSERVKGERAVAAVLLVVAASVHAQQPDKEQDDKPIIVLPAPGGLQTAPPPGQTGPRDGQPHPSAPGMPGMGGQQPDGPTAEQRAAARERMLRDAVSATREELADAEPEHEARLHFNLGFLYQQLHDFEKAEEEYREAMRLADDQPLVKARACQNLGVISQSQAGKEITADPGKCLKLLKNAETCYLEAMREAPDSEDVCQNQEMLLQQRKLALQLKEVADKLAALRKRAQEETGKAMSEQTEANAARSARDKVREQAQAKAQARQAKKAVDGFEQAVRQMQQEQAAEVIKQAGEEIDKAIAAENRAMQSLSNEEERREAGDEAVQHLQKALELLGVKPPEQDKQDNQDQDESGQGQNDQQQEGDEGKEEEKDGEDKQQGQEQQPGEEQQAQPAKEGEEEEEIDENRARAILLQIQEQEKELREALKEERMKNGKLKGVDRDW